MKWLVSLFFVASSVTFGAELDGIWTSEARSLGGLGSQWIFVEGRATYVFGAIVEFTYRVNGSRLETTFDDARGGGESSSRDFVIQGDNLTLDPSSPKRRQVMKRVRGGPSIVGEWTYNHYTGGPAFMRYWSDGRGQLVVPMITMEGTYNVEGERVQISLPPENISTSGLVHGGSLSLRDEKGGETRFERSAQPDTQSRR